MITEQEDLLREMTHNAGKPSPEAVLLQRRLDKARDELRQQQAIADHQKQQIDRRLEEEVRILPLLKHIIIYIKPTLFYASQQNKMCSIHKLALFGDLPFQKRKC